MVTPYSSPNFSFLFFFLLIRYKDFSYFGNSPIQLMHITLNRSQTSVCDLQLSAVNSMGRCMMWHTIIPPNVRSLHSLSSSHIKDGNGDVVFSYCKHEHLKRDHPGSFYVMCSSHTQFVCPIYIHISFYPQVLLSSRRR